MTFAFSGRRGGAFVASFVTSLALAGSARADAEADAKDLFARAHATRKAGDCGGAVPLFRKAYAIYPKGLGSLRNIAECEEQLGHFASSRRAWLDMKRALIVLPAPDPKYDGWEKDADDAAARLQPKIATVTVDVTVKTPQSEGPANEKSGVELLVNGESLGTTLVGTPLERDPGTYAIRAQAPDAQPVEQSVSLNAGDHKRVALRLVRTPRDGAGGAGAGPSAGAGSGGGTVEPPGEPRDTGSGQRTIGWIVTGVGAAALVGGVVTLVLRGSAVSDLDAKCPNGRDKCPAGSQSDVDSIESRGKTMSTLTSILLPVGVVGVGAGLALVLTAGSSKSGASGASGASVTIRPGLGGGTAVLRF